MRLVRKCSLFAAELVVSLFGFVFSLLLAVVARVYLAPRDISGNDLMAVIAAVLGLLLTAVACRAIWRIAEPWRATDGTAAWVRSRAARKLHPGRARTKRLALRVLVCLPSCVAVVVFFFFPIATHLVHPGSQYIRHYRIPIPWTFTVLSSPALWSDHSSVAVMTVNEGRGRFGVTPFLFAPYWGRPEPYSVMIFGSDPSGHSATHHERLGRAQMATDPISKELILGSVSVTCSQYQPRPEYRGHVSPYAFFNWSVVCSTPSTAPHHFYAHFDGFEEDLGVFYQIVKDIRPAD